MMSSRSPGDGPRALIVSTIGATVRAFLLPFIEDLRRLGWTVDVACTVQDERAVLEAAVGPDGRVHDLALSRNPLRVDGQLRSARVLRRLLSSGGYDLVQSHTPIASALVRLSLPKRPRPVVVYFAHGFHFQELQGGPGRPWRLMERALVGRTDHLIVINSADEALAAGIGYPPERIHRLPGVGVDLSRYVPPPRRPTTAAVAILGALQSRKEPLAALDVSILLPELEFHFAGDGPLGDKMGRRIAEHGLGDRVRLHGRVDDVPGLLQGSRALLFLSHQEGLPRSVLEAVSCGVPVVAFPIRGVVDILDGQPWWFVPKSREPRDVARAVEEAVAYEPDVAAMRASLEKFQLGAVVARHSRLLEAALPAADAVTG
jgi:glycosyltransferase involved in cell wall biosynthesis